MHRSRLTVCGNIEVVEELDAAGPPRYRFDIDVQVQEGVIGALFGFSLPLGLPRPAGSFRISATYGDGDLQFKRYVHVLTTPKFQTTSEPLAPVTATKIYRRRKSITEVC